MNTKLMAMGLAAGLALFSAHAMACDGMEEMTSSESNPAVAPAKTASTTTPPAADKAVAAKTASATKSAKGKAAPASTKTTLR